MTVTGTIRGVENVASAWGLTFTPLDTPSVVSGLIAASNKVRIQTDSAGAFSVELLEGRYTVQIDNENGDEFDIDVPALGGPSDIATLWVSTGSASATQYQISGHGSPEGARRGDPGWLYTDLDTENLWRKLTGTGTTGWFILIGA